MKLEPFFVDTLTSALELGIGTPDDVLRHLTPDVLARVLPRPLWARLLTACLGAPRVDARLVVDTIGIPNLCAHAPAPLVWACIAELGARALGGAEAPRPAAPAPASASAPSTRSGPLLAPPPEAAPPPPPAPASAAPAVRGPSIPTPAIADLSDELEPDGRAPSRPRAPTSQRFRPSNTSAGRLGTRDSRRPQAQATPPRDPQPPVRDTRRSLSEATEAETEVSFSNDSGSDWRESLAVEDSQLVDWQAAEETQAGDEPRKR